MDFNTLAVEQLSKVIDLAPEEISAALVRPPKPEMGDIGFPCFILARTYKAPPAKIAADIAEKLAATEPFSDIKPVGPYVNFVIDTAAIARQTVGSILAAPEEWGRSEAGKGKTVVIDYSSPNIAKPLGVHHIRSTMIGAALARMYAACGWKVITVNHLGDWGTTFGQLMVSYKKAERENPDVPVDIDALLRLYIQFHSDADEDEGLKDEAREWFRKLEDGDAEAVRLWEIFLSESLKSLKKLYARLGVDFDYYTGESFFNDKMASTADRIESAGLLSESDGAMVVDLEDYEMPPCLIRKRDGATTYATRDLAAAEYRRTEYRFDRCLYVVANQQELHFRQIFKTLELLKYDWAADCIHVKFGMLSFGKGVFGEESVTGSTRKGNVIYLEEVLDRAVNRSREIIEANARDEKVAAEIDELAEMVGVGSVIFSEFIQRRMKDVKFTWEKVLNQQGDSGVYLQYTHARLSSVVKKFGEKLPATINWSRLETDFERDVMLKLIEFQPAVCKAVEENEPSTVATFLLELCSVFNRMYTDKERHRIVSDDTELTAARIGLVESVRLTLATGLKMLGLGAPERM